MGLIWFTYGMLLGVGLWCFGKASCLEVGGLICFGMVHGAVLDSVGCGWFGWGVVLGGVVGVGLGGLWEIICSERPAVKWLAGV